MCSLTSFCGAARFKIFLLLPVLLQVYHISALPAYKCPGLSSENPVLVSLPSGTSREISLEIPDGSPHSLCILTRITPNPPEGATMGISGNVPKNGSPHGIFGNMTSSYIFAATPSSQDIGIISSHVIRSYGGHDWERVPGDYASAMSDPVCTGSVCTANITLSSREDASDLFYLVTYDHKEFSSLDGNIARFLDKNTFGPTQKEINDFDTSTGSDQDFALWVKEQMNATQTPPEYHRSFFRKNINRSMPLAGRTVKPQHPCDDGTRWRRYSFHSFDREKYVNVTSLDPNGVDPPFLMIVDGYPRTIVQNLQYWNWEIEKYKKIPPGIYKVCWQPEESSGGWAGLYPTDPMMVDFEDCLEIRDGNPPLSLTSEVLSDYDNIFTTALPFASLDAMTESPMGERIHGDETTYILERGLRDLGLCDTTFSDYFSNSGIGNVVIGTLHDGTQLYFDSRMALEENTLTNPLSDGGGENIDAGLECSSAPRTFLNQDHCILSESDNACSARVGREDYEIGSTILLSVANVTRLHELTGQYLYIMTGFKMDWVESPCTYGLYSKWLSTDKSSSECKTSGIDSATKKTIKGLLDNSWGSEVMRLTENWEDETCDENNKKTIGMQIFHNGQCWEHVHPDEYEVYEMNYWTRPDTHPGNKIMDNNGFYNPIKKFWDIDKTPFLSFPASHPIDRWINNREWFHHIGTIGDYVEYKWLPVSLRYKGVAMEFGRTSTGKSNKGFLVCGSEREDKAETTATPIFDFIAGESAGDYLRGQNSNIWTMIALNSKDQLRQRMAWALSQILVVTENQIDSEQFTEIFLNYYDIFVKHAFGNYRDVLKEISYSPMMAEMLSYLNSRSTSRILETEGIRVFPDENFAREVMQLFSIGTILLNMDGTPILNPETNLPIPTYDNFDIMSFARAWTGFNHQPERGNIETEWNPNRIDPLNLEAFSRDQFPKRDLNNGFIGDGYPLCVDLPSKGFLIKGATFHLLGKKPLPYFSYVTVYEHIENSDDIKYFQLDSSNSELYNNLCNSSDGQCNFRNIVTLDSNLKCEGEECSIDSLTVIKVAENVFYEYIRPPCVEVPFSNKLISIRQWWPLNSMCLDKNIDYIAREVCVPNGWDGGFNRCRFSEEKISFAGAKKRCENEKYPYGDKSSMDDWKWAEPNGEFGDTPECGVWNEEYWQWAKADCTVSVKVNEDGNIAVVHDPDLSFANEDREGTEDYFKVHSLVDSDNNNFFSVNWTNDKYPKPSNACAGSNCDIVAGSCHCDVNVVSTPVFTQSSLPTGPDDVIAKLKIGSFHPDWYDTTPGSTYIFDSIVNSVSIYHQDGGTDFDVKTIFSIEFRGETRFYKNIASSIELVVGGYKFRNPPYFVNWAIPQKQQMIYETEAVLDTYFYHNNVAPFLSNLIIKRFGISNPSPRYIKVAASAFKTGSFLFNESMKFGSGKYGDLGAMLAAIVLDREALSPVLDSDPTYGSLKEPLLKFIKLMRSMEFVPNAEMPQIKLEHIDQKLNQMPYRYPNVFSFFLPDYSPSGPLSLASLTGPEAQILTTPTIISFLNGMISLIDIGLHECFGGFGRTIDWWCDYNEKEWFEEDSQSSGHLNFSPSDPNDASIIVNELSLLLTNDRLNDDSKTKIIKQVKKAMKDTDDSNAGLRLAQKLIVSTPEFQSQNQMKFSGANRPDFEQPTPSEKEYKAIVYIFLDGGADSFNMLAPYTCSNGLYESYQLERGSISLSKEELLEINSNNPDQPCSVFGLHPRFNQLQNLYNKGEVLFAANIGVLTEFVTKDDWYLKHDGQTQLFAHNVQAEEIQKVDIFNEQAGKGMLGRLLDILSSKGHKTNAISVHGESNVLVGNTPVIFVDSSGVEKFNPIPWSDDIEPVIKDLNNGMTSTSGLFGETWSRLLYKALGENKILFEALKDADPTESFPETHLGEQLLTVSKLMKIRNIRGSDRDSFYVSIGGFDNHSNLKSEFDNRVAEIDEALGVFAAEMDVQNTWNSVAVVVVSEFARTLTPNSGQGSDHAWGGNYFIAGGLVNGGKVIGDYPTDFSLKSPLNIDRGRLIPTRSWDSLWNGIVEWFGASERIELDTVLPNRANFQSVLFSKADMFRSPVVSVKGKIEFKLSKMMSNIDESISLAVVNVAKGKLEDLLGKKKLKKKVKARFVDLEISWLKSSFNESKKVMKIECEIRLEYAEEPKVSSLAKEIKKSMKKDVARFKDLGEEFKKMKKNITTLKVEN